MSDLLESLMYGMGAGINLAKRAVPKLTTMNEIVALNRDVFLPVTSEVVTEISVNLFG